ncbi:MAG TPA: hypothetical protein PK054_01705 [Anaerohalosphaeraceae bacterium]|nr:hypothetical protein [Anaerohalosphaeraceae bacterium]HOL88028.1 hypothetical protein [Anaerohalosphaeraceae bacterium]HPP55276.1 hypothetical protein [Anaerohalosphaeraceae bacterium]
MKKAIWESHPKQDVSSSDKDTLKDYSILQKAPRRCSCPVRAGGSRREEWAAVFNGLRVPILLLGVVGALGLLAHYRPQFVRVVPVMYWPNWWISVLFLTLAGIVTAVLTADWIAVRFLKRFRNSRTDGRDEYVWRSR